MESPAITSERSVRMGAHNYRANKDLPCRGQCESALAGGCRPWKCLRLRESAISLARVILGGGAVGGACSPVINLVIAVVVRSTNGDGDGTEQGKKKEEEEEQEEEEEEDEEVGKAKGMNNEGMKENDAAMARPLSARFAANAPPLPGHLRHSEEHTAGLVCGNDLVSRYEASRVASAKTSSLDGSEESAPALAYRRRCSKSSWPVEWRHGRPSALRAAAAAHTIDCAPGNSGELALRAPKVAAPGKPLGFGRAQASKGRPMAAAPLLLLALVWAAMMLAGAPLRSVSGAIVKPPGFRELEKQIVDRILGEGYDKRIRPTGINNKTGQNDGPAVVRVNTLIRSISKIDDVTMEYSVQLSLRQEWVDERLAFKRLSEYKSYNINSITLTEQERLWKPDLFFRNEKEGHFHKIIMPNVLLRINGDGAVLYSIRISLVLACPMDLKYYPLDKQNCTIEMASYGYLDDDLKFTWKETSPVQINQPLTLPRFTLETFGTAFCTSRTATGAYSCLRVDLIFKREFSYYLIQIYIPCCMLVIVSWVSFWLDPNAIPARVSLGVTTLLTMATQISGINASLPPVSYTKAIDVWTGVCLTFVFGALLEFALVNYASRSDAHARMQQARQEEELRARELEFQQRQQLAAAAAAAAAAANQHQHHQQQQQQHRQYYGQKFAVSRSDVAYQQQQQQPGPKGAAQLASNGGNGKVVGQQGQQPNKQQQYTIIETGEQLIQSNADKQALANGLSGQLGPMSAKQCEIHHSSGLHHQTLGSGTHGSQARANKGKVNFCRAWLNKFPSRSKRIDVISRIFFPKMFALFNLVYWTTYLFREDDIVQA